MTPAMNSSELKCVWDTQATQEETWGWECVGHGSAPLDGLTRSLLSHPARQDLVGFGSLFPATEIALEGGAFHRLHLGAPVSFS